MKGLDELGSNLEIITKTICTIHGMDDATTQLYLDVADNCTKHFKMFADNPQYSHVVEILKESDNAATLVDLTNLLNIVLNGHVLVTKAQVMSGNQYHRWLFELTLLVLSIFYQFGYTDGSRAVMPDAFDDFISSLDIDDK